jgi:MFS family permease
VILAAFRSRSFRFQWPADLLTSWASEMETLILGWYVMVHTGSVLLLTLFGSLQFLGTLAAPMFGVLGDRLGSRALLCAIRLTCGLLAVTLMGLDAAGLLTPALVLLLAAVGGIVRPNDLVMRNALIGETVGGHHLMGALALSRTTQDSARVAGALAGAGLSAHLGVAGAYLFVTTFYAVSLALTFRVSGGRPVPDPGSSGPAGERASPHRVPRPSGWRDLADGLVYVWTTPKVLAAMCLAFLVNLTAYPLTGGLLPYVARDIYRIDATGLGLLVGSFSLGALLGSIGMVRSALRCRC